MRISIEKFKTLLLMLAALFFYYIGYDVVNSSQVQRGEAFIVILSWIGIIVFAMCFINWKNLSGKWFSLYTIFYVFLCLFMFGQCFMWALGIHDDAEIGKMNLFRFGVPATTKGILMAQLMAILGVVMINSGVCLFYKNNYNHTFEAERQYSTKLSKDDDLYFASAIACFAGTLATFYSLARNIVVNRIYGYGATLYNADVVSGQSNLILLVRMLFFPALVGILIGSNFDYKVRKFVYTLFAVFSAVSLLAGDRGEWIFPLLILIWIHHNYVNEINRKKVIVYILSGIVLVCVSVAVRNVRSDGVTLEAILNDLSSGENPIFSAFFEFGRGMQHSAILLERGWKTYPYGNTYLLAILGMVTDAIPRALINGYQSLATWYSSTFLSISYGAGFSIVAEGLVNFGPFFFWIPLFIIGAVLSRLAFSIDNNSQNNCEIDIFMKISITYCAIQGIRNTSLTSLKTFIFSTALIYVATLLLKGIRKRT